MIAGVSREQGVEHITCLKEPVTSHTFIQYVKDLIKKNKGVKFCLFMDNLAAHRTRDVLNFLRFSKV